MHKLYMSFSLLMVLGMDVAFAGINGKGATYRNSPTDTNARKRLITEEKNRTAALPAASKGAAASSVSAKAGADKKAGVTTRSSSVKK